MLWGKSDESLQQFTHTFGLWARFLLPSMFVLKCLVMYGECCHPVKAIRALNMCIFVLGNTNDATNCSYRFSFSSMAHRCYSLIIDTSPK